MCFFLTIDVEEDNQWRRTTKASYNNIEGMIEIQSLCDDYCITPTYLITYGVSKNEESKEIIRELFKAGNCEIGSHLHPWTTPPYNENFVKFAFPHTYLSELPTDLLSKKIINQTNSIEELSGQKPTSFRSGRYGLDGRVVALLRELDYKVDTSITPLYNWGHHRGTKYSGPNFSDAPFSPYFINECDIVSNSKFLGDIIEVPITIRKIGTNYIWLRPFPGYSITDLLELCQFIVDHENKPILNMMFHSSEWMTNCSKYNTSKHQKKELINKVRSVFDFVKKKNLKCIGLSEFSDENQ